MAKIIKQDGERKIFILDDGSEQSFGSDHKKKNKKKDKIKYGSVKNDVKIDEGIEKVIDEE